MMRDRGVANPASPSRLGDGAEKIGPGGEIIGARALVGAEQRLQLRPSGFADGVDRDIVDALKESIEESVRAEVGGAELDERVLDRGAESLAIEMAPGDADDARGLGELIAHFAMKQRGV